MIKIGFIFLPVCPVETLKVRSLNGYKLQKIMYKNLRGA